MVSRAESSLCSQASFRMGPSGGSGGQRAEYTAFVSGEIRRRRTNPPAKPPRGPEWFRKMDRNNDTDVSRREFLGTDAQFKEIDADSDGLISVEEAEKYDKKKREGEKK